MIDINEPDVRPTYIVHDPHAPLHRLTQASCAIHASPSLKETLSQYLLDRIEAAGNVRVMTFSVVTELSGDQELHAIRITNSRTGEEAHFETRWLFVCIGGDPRTQWAEEVGIERDQSGYLVTGPDLALNNGQLFGVLRIAVTGQQVSPPLFETLEILGKAESLRRIKLARDSLKQPA